MTRQTIQHTIEIERAADEVFAVVDGHERDGAWRNGFVAIVLTTPGPVTVGSEYRETVKTFGRLVEATVHVREHRPGRRLVYDVQAGNSPFIVTHRFEPAPDGTRLTRTIEADFGPIGPVARLFATLLRRSLAPDLPALKRLIESSHPDRLAA